MKPNNRHHWTILLIGRREVARLKFVGRLDDALSRADVFESQVDFTVLQYQVIRGKRA